MEEKRKLERDDRQRVWGAPQVIFTSTFGVLKVGTFPIHQMDMMDGSWAILLVQP